MERAEIIAEPAFGQPWYYTIELSPGLYTPGERRPNVALTRSLLRRVRVEPGMRCLDIGTQEGLVPILLRRRAAEVVAYDRIYSEERLNLVRTALDEPFELIGQPVSEHNERLWLGRGGPTPGQGMPLRRLPVELTARGHAPFDLVVFSGVLYHVYDPLAALAIVRGTVREGGIVIVETAAVFDSELSLHLNARSRFNPLSIWLASLGALDYMLRLVRLAPFAVAFTGRDRGRVAVACRAVAEPPADDGDEWLGSPLHDFELAEYLDWDAVHSDEESVNFEGEPGRINLSEAVAEGVPLSIQPEQERLHLGAAL